MVKAIMNNLFKSQNLNATYFCSLFFILKLGVLHFIKTRSNEGWYIN